MTAPFHSTFLYQREAPFFYFAMTPRPRKKNPPKQHHLLSADCPHSPVMLPAFFSPPDPTSYLSSTITLTQSRFKNLYSALSDNLRTNRHLTWTEMHHSYPQKPTYDDNTHSRPPVFTYLRYILLLSLLSLLNSTPLPSPPSPPIITFPPSQISLPHIPNLPTPYSSPSSSVHLLI